MCKYQEIVEVKELEKIISYQDLIIKIERFWSKQGMVIPVVIGILGTISKKNLAWYLENVLIDKISICQLQKVTMLGSTHMLH